MIDMEKFVEIIQVWTGFSDPYHVFLFFIDWGERAHYYSIYKWMIDMERFVEIIQVWTGFSDPYHVFIFYFYFFFFFKFIFFGVLRPYLIIYTYSMEARDMIIDGRMVGW
jgi:hypothetical protein